MYIVVEPSSPGTDCRRRYCLRRGRSSSVLDAVLRPHLAAALGFAAFGVVFLQREIARSRWWLLAAGVVAGLAVVVEFPLAIVAVVLGSLCGCTARDRSLVRDIRRRVAIGLVPLAAYNWWAFGLP